MQYRELLHEWVWYFHEQVSENAAHECNNRDMHANECNKMFIIHTRAASFLFPHKVPKNIFVRTISQHS